jgi:hypothetical protein
VDAAAAGTDRAGLGAARPMARPADRRPPPSGLIPLTCNEVQELFAVQVARPVGDHGQRLRWSVWRRRHQARARTCHDRPQAPGNREDRDLRLEYQPQHFMVAPCLRSGARQWRRDPVTVLRALATLTRMVRDDCAGGEARGRRVEQSAWVVLWLVRADYPLASRRRSELPAFAAASHLARSGTRSEGAGDGGRNGPGTPGI